MVDGLRMRRNNSTSRPVRDWGRGRRLSGISASSLACKEGRLKPRYEEKKKKVEKKKYHPPAFTEWGGGSFFPISSTPLFAGKGARCKCTNLYSTIRSTLKTIPFPVSRPADPKKEEEGSFFKKYGLSNYPHDPHITPPTIRYTNIPLLA